MLQVNNQTPFKVSLALFPNEDGVDCAYGAVKATFRMTGAGASVADEQLPFVAADEFWGDPAKSSLKTAAEVGLSKPATDVLVRGHAYAPVGRATRGEASVKVGPLQKILTVFGDRVWEKGLFGLRISAPQPFEKVPLCYERAFGGTDPEPGNQAKVEYEPRNPVGRGLVFKRSRVPVKDAPLPNLEDPEHLIKGPGDHPVPACFGPICAHWEPRKSLAGTYSQEWEKKRAPFLPEDFNPRFFQTAPPGLVSKTHLKGGEDVELSGMTREARLRFFLPVCKLQVLFHFDGKPMGKEPSLDTIFFEPDEKRFVMIWRASQVVDKKVHRLRELEVRCTGVSSAGGSA